MNMWFSQSFHYYASLGRGACSVYVTKCDKSTRPPVACEQFGKILLRISRTRYLKQCEPNSWPHSSGGSNSSITRYLSAIGIPYFVTMHKISIFFFHILTFHNRCSSPLHRTPSISPPRCLQSVFREQAVFILQSMLSRSLVNVCATEIFSYSSSIQILAYFYYIRFILRQIPRFLPLSFRKYVSYDCYWDISPMSAQYWSVCCDWVLNLIPLKT
jgi:hypothetical protein